jgi:hypothetical protein
MTFDPSNKIVILCSKGMDKESEGKAEEASQLFLQAWNEATSDMEKFIAAHYVARIQKTISDKLIWDQNALDLALKLNDEKMKGSYPSLYLNIAKCYEDKNDRENARINYESALSYSHFLPDDGYGKMILSGINQGIKRITK